MDGEDTAPAPALGSGRDFFAHLDYYRPRALVHDEDRVVVWPGLEPQAAPIRTRGAPLSHPDRSYTPEQGERLAQIHQRVVEARRELDALIGDAYLRPRASIVPVHFLDLASAVEKLRWAEKEWRELDEEIAGEAPKHGLVLEDEEEPEEPAELLHVVRD